MFVVSFGQWAFAVKSDRAIFLLPSPSSAYNRQKFIGQAKLVDTVGKSIVVMIGEKQNKTNNNIPWVFQAMFATERS